MSLLLKYVARAVVKHGGKFLLNLIPGGEVLADIAADVWENWCQKRDEAELRAEVEALAQAPPEQVRSVAVAAVGAEATGQPPELQEVLTTYLTQVPAMIRRSLRRFSDPTGTTVPATKSFRGSEDLLPFLPPRPPRFKADDLAPGLDWVLLELLGVGGFGEVWKARHRYLTSEPLVALKFCLDDSEAASKALRNEAGILDRVKRQGRHSGIVALRQTHFSARPPCLEYEYVEGGDLTGLIHELRQKGQLTPRFATRVLLTLAQTVGFAHQGTPPIVHCDLKPANVLVQRNAKGELVLRITDFGIGGLAARHAIHRTRFGATSRSEMVTEAVRGAYTPFYAPPEQIGRRRDQCPDPRDDIHALGMIWYQLVTGSLGLTSLPSDWRDLVQEHGLSAEGIQLLSECIASKPEKRPANAVDLADRLSKFLSEAPPLTSLPKPEPPPPQAEVPPIQHFQVDVSGTLWRRTAGAGPPNGPLNAKWEEVCRTPARINVLPGEEYLLVSYPDVADADLAGLAHLRGLTALQSLGLMGCERITDAGLAQLRNLTALQHLDLRGCEHVTDAGLAQLRNLTALQDLSLWGCKKVTDAGLAHLRGLTALESLELYACRITDAGLAHLSGLTALQSLELRDCAQITDTGIAALQKALPDCRIIR